QQLREKQRPGCGLDRCNLLRAEAAPLESDLIYSGQPCAIAGNHRKRRHVLRDLGSSCHECVRTDATKLMHPAHALEIYEFLEHAMSADLRGVHQDAIVADDAIVSDVSVRHYQHMVADQRAHPANLGAAMNRGELADRIVVANLESCRLAVKF